MVIRSPVVSDEVGQSIAATPVYPVGVDAAGAPVSIGYTDAAGYPAGSTILQGSSGNVAAASASVTLASATSQTVYLTGFDFTFTGATATSKVVATITGLAGGTRSYVIAVPAGVDVAGQPLALRFDPPLKAAATATDVVLSVPSLGAGNTNATLNAQGFRV
ncbi:MAG: hypothetical protein J7521_20325 [Caulobacter sp.]|nr:hypothetical protein [Caulobacter sp.]